MPNICGKPRKQSVSKNGKSLRARWALAPATGEDACVAGNAPIELQAKIKRTKRCPTCAPPTEDNSCGRMKGTLRSGKKKQRKLQRFEAFVQNLSLGRRNETGSIVPVNRARPFDVLSLGISCATTDEPVTVRFFNDGGYVAEVPAVFPDSVEVVVPPYVAPVTGTLEEGTVSVEVSFGDGSTRTVSGDLTIEAPPQSTPPPGRLTLAYLRGVEGVLRDTQDSIQRLSGKATLVGADPIRDFLAGSLADLAVLVARIESVAGGGPAVRLGSWPAAGGDQPLTLDLEALRVSDRLVLAFVRALNADGGNAGKLVARGLGMRPRDELDDAVQDFLSRLRRSAADALDAGRRAASVSAWGFGVLTARAAILGTASLPALATLTTVSLVATTFAPAANAFVYQAGFDIAEDHPPEAIDYVPMAEYVAQNIANFLARRAVGGEVAKAFGPEVKEAFSLGDRAFGLTAGAVGAGVGVVRDAMGVVLPPARGELPEPPCVPPADRPRCGPPSVGYRRCTQEEAFSGKYRAATYMIFGCGSCAGIYCPDSETTVTSTTLAPACIPVGAACADVNSVCCEIAHYYGESSANYLYQAACDYHHVCCIPFRGYCGSDSDCCPNLRCPPSLPGEQARQCENCCDMIKGHCSARECVNHQ